MNFEGGAQMRLFAAVILMVHCSPPFDNETADGSTPMVVGNDSDMAVALPVGSTDGGGGMEEPMVDNCLMRAGNHYYLSPSGDDGAAGNETSPWKTFDRAYK